MSASCLRFGVTLGIMALLRPPWTQVVRSGRWAVDKATKRYRLAMIEPGTDGMCRYCGHHVDDLHERVSAESGYVWCKTCYTQGVTCPAGTKLTARAQGRASSRRTM